MSKRLRLLCGLVLLAAGTLVLALNLLNPVPKGYVATFAPKAYEGALQNPLTGFAAWAENVEAAQDASLVFVLFTWREWEPQEGVYDIAGITEKYNLDRWRQENKRVILRFVCDYPGEESHMDIPDWLYARTGDGVRYDIPYGKGYAPNYENEVFISRHSLAVKALGAAFGQDDFVAFVELGSLGHWGEWHVLSDAGLPRIPGYETRLQYVLPYVSAFPQAKLLLRRPLREAAELGLGLYNDMTASLADTQEWLGWIREGGLYGQTLEEEALAPMPEAWRTAPVGGELGGELVKEKLLGTELSSLLALLRESHQTFIGPRNPAEVAGGDEAYQGALDTVLATLGYRLRVLKAEARVPEGRSSAEVTVTLTWVNDGIAPFFWDWPVSLYLLDESGAIAAKTDLSLRLTSVIDAQPVQSAGTLPVSALASGEYKVAVAVQDPALHQPGLALAMENSRDDLIYVLGPVTLP